MRTSNIYGVQVPELGDRADITVVSDAILDNENNQSGKVEYMKATISGTIISLVSEVRQDKLLKYYNGLSVQFVSTADINVGKTYKIKIDNLAEQPYDCRVNIKNGDIVTAIYTSTGFITYQIPIRNDVALKNITITAGNGLQGGGDLSANRTINIVSADDGIIVNADNIKLNIVDDAITDSSTRPGSAKQIKLLNDNKQAKNDNNLKTPSKEIVGAINENYDFMNYSLYSGSISEIDPQYKKATFRETLYALYNARKLPKILYIAPKDFTDLSDWSEQNTRYEVTILGINASYGIKGVAHISDYRDVRFFYSWNLSGDITSIKIDNYTSGIKKTEIIQKGIEKKAGKGYIDTYSNELYYCFKDAPASITSPNSEYFVKATNIELAKGRTIITTTDNYIIEKYDNGLLIQHGIWGKYSQDVTKFPIPFVKGFSLDREEYVNKPFIVGAMGYGNNTTQTISLKVYTVNTNLTDISFILTGSAGALVTYTAVGYWK